MVRCSADGEPEVVEQCDDGTICHDGGCRDLCDDPDYLTDASGCEHWAVPTLNSLLGSQQLDAMTPQTLGADGFRFAIVVTNSNQSPVDVHVAGPSVDLVRRVAAGAAEVIPLPWVPQVSQVDPGGLPSPEHLAGLYRGTPAVLARNAAYHLTSTGPVVAYQFNPLNYADGTDASLCQDPSTFVRYCYSHTNDASLLRPVQSLGQRYHAVSRAGLAFHDRCGDPAHEIQGGPSGFVTIIGASEQPTDVTVHARVAMRAGDGAPRVEPGTSITRTLRQGDVWQLVADSPRDRDECEPLLGDTCTSRCLGALDPTGTRIEATRPVAVFSGHDCAKAPESTLSCEHLEEQLLPSDAIGRDFIVAPLPRFWPAQGPSLLRVVATEDGTAIAFEPPSVHDAITLDEGEHVELELLVAARVVASHPIAVHQFQTGQGYASLPADFTQYFFAYSHYPSVPGSDPTMIAVAPSSAWGTSYSIFIPDTYNESRVLMIAPGDTRVRVDGVATEATSTGLGHAIIDRVVTPGRHILTAERPFAALVVGGGAYTAYGYAAGRLPSRVGPD